MSCKPTQLLPLLAVLAAGSATAEDAVWDNIAKSRGLVSWVAMKCPPDLVRVTDAGSAILKLYDKMDWSEERENISNAGWDLADDQLRQKPLKSVCLGAAVLIPELVERY